MGFQIVFSSFQMVDCGSVLFVILINAGPELIDGLMLVLWGILDFEQPDTQTMNNIVISSVELIYSYAECLSLHGKDTAGSTVGPAVELFKKLLFFPNEAVQASSRFFYLFYLLIYFFWVSYAGSLDLFKIWC